MVIDYPILPGGVALQIEPSVTAEVAHAWLQAEAKYRWGEIPAAYDFMLGELAKSMATLSEVAIPGEVDPFGNYFQIGERVELDSNE